MTQEILDRTYNAYGGASEVIESTELEVLADSGAGTGKSLAWCRKIDYLCREYPGSRWFFARDTRKSLTESVLELFENEVLWPGHPAMTGDAKRANREKYTYPNGRDGRPGAEIILIGLDDVDRHMSTRFDGGVIFEAHETTETVYEKLLSRLRNFVAPYHQLGCDVNPQGELNWLNLRFPRDNEANPRVERDRSGDVTISRRRVRFDHSDNPMLYDHALGVWTEKGKVYIKQVLGSLTGATRERLLHHRWVSEEGQIWPEYGEHSRVYSKDVPEIVAYFASVDFGDTVPTAFQVWGVDKKDEAYRVAEIYQAGLSQDQLAFGVNELWKKTPFARGVADCADPRFIRFLNDKISDVCGRQVDRVFIECEKKAGKLAGLSHTRDMLRQGKIRFVKDSNWNIVTDTLGRMQLVPGVDPRLRVAKRPSCTEQEIPGYVWAKNEDGKPIKERPDPSRPNDGCDAVEYFAMFKWNRDVQPDVKRWVFKKPRPGYMSVADAIGFHEIAEKEGW